MEPRTSNVVDIGGAREEDPPFKVFLVGLRESLSKTLRSEYRTIARRLKHDWRVQLSLESHPFLREEISEILLTMQAKEIGKK